MAPEKKKVLVIDDQEEVRELVEAALRDGGFEIFKASGGREGIQIAKNTRPDIILLDIMMPNFDGISTCKILKRNPITIEIPVIFLTAKHGKEDVKAALQAGGKDYVMKPFSPDDLLKRIQKWMQEQEKIFDPSTVIEKESLSTVISGKTETKPKKKTQQIDFLRIGNVMTLSSTYDRIVMGNLKLFRDAFLNIISDEFTKIAFNIDALKKIDGAGLGFLISAHVALKSHGGGLHITYPGKDLNQRFSFINLNYIFPAYKNINEIVESFKENVVEEEIPNVDSLNICLSCTFVNPSGFRYCGNCESNLLISRGDEICEGLRRTVSRKVFLEAQTDDISEMNKKRNINVEVQPVPKEFDVDLLGEELSVSYKSILVDDSHYSLKERIAIQAPSMSGQMLPVGAGMKLILKNKQVGRQSVFNSEVLDVDYEAESIIVRYTELAKNIHTRNYFSLDPKTPIPIKLINPSLKSEGKIFKGIILELSRVGMIVFSEENLPVKKCLAVHFRLPGGSEINTPLVMVEKSEKNSIHDVDFVVIDEKERSEIIQYMYKRQIELSK